MPQNLFPAFQGGTPEVPPIQTHLDVTGYQPDCSVTEEQWVLGTTTPAEFIRIARKTVSYEANLDFMWLAAGAQYDRLCARAMGEDAEPDDAWADQLRPQIGAAVKDYSHELPASYVYEVVGLSPTGITFEELKEAKADLDGKKTLHDAASRDWSRAVSMRQEQSRLSKVPRRILISIGAVGTITAFAGTATYLRAGNTANAQVGTAISPVEVSEPILTQGEELGIGMTSAGLGLALLAGAAASQLKRYAHFRARRKLKNMRLR